MNSDSNLQSNVAIIYQSLEEVHTLLSVLEKQIRSGLFPAQPEINTEINTVEMLIPEELPVLEEPFILEDVFKDIF